MRERFLAGNEHYYTEVCTGKPLPLAQGNRLRLVRTDARRRANVYRRVAVDVQWYRLGGNKHKHLSITGSVSDPTGRWLESCGQVTEAIERVYPELRHIMKWHLMDEMGPMHYIANTVYHAGDGRKGQQRIGYTDSTRTKTAPMWECVGGGPQHGVRIADECPPDEVTVLTWKPVLEEGKDRDLAAARASAIWPDATDEQLMLPAPELTALLQARLPALMEQFHQDMAALGFNTKE